MSEKQLRRTIIIGFIVIAAIIAGIITFVVHQNTQPQTGYTQTEYHDPGSGQTIIDTDGKTPETFGANPNAPILVGFSNLYDRGFSQSQNEAVKAALNDYANQQLTAGKEKITEISLTTDSISHSVNRDTGESTYTMTLTFNRKTTYTLQVVPDDATLTLAVSLSQNNAVLFTESQSFEDE